MTTIREAKALLSQGRFKEAGRVFESLQNYRLALQAYSQGQMWKDAGRVCEKDGKTDKAMHFYRQARSPADAARVLRQLGRHEEAAKSFAEAGEFLAAAEQFEAEFVRIKGRSNTLEAQKKLLKWAGHYRLKGGEAEKAAHLLKQAGEPFKAAQALAAAGQPAEAARIYLELDMRQEAIETLMRADRPLDAARMCEEMEEFVLAGRLYHQGKDYPASLRAFERAHRWLEAAEVGKLIPDWAKVGEMMARGGNYLDSARAYLEASLPDDAIKSICYLKYTDPRYMEAVHLTVDALEKKGDMSFNAERFLNEFMYRDLTADGAELLYRLAQVYEKGEFWETAQEYYEKILAFDPNYRDVSQLLEKMLVYQKDSAAVYKKVLKEDFGYEQTTKRMKGRSEPLRPDEDLEAFDDLEPEGNPAAAPGTPPAAPPVAPAPPVAAPPPFQPTPDQRASQPTQAVAVTGQPVADVGPSAGSAPTAMGGDVGQTSTDVQPPPLIRLEPGARLGERYELAGRIGAGGRGAVFKAMDLELDEMVAIKVIHPTDVTEQSLGWFRQEIKLARKLTHPNIIRLYDISEVDGLRFITMEYLQGHDLEAVVEEAGGQLPFGMGLHFVRQICDGLAAAHEIGVIHRDIKPPNVMVIEGGVVKLLDFGIAKLMDVKGISRTGLAYGTPLYMSPEQIRGAKDLDTRTDLYSLGCLMFQLFTGELPFEAEETFELMLAHINQDPPSPRGFRADMPAPLEEIILRLLEKDPDDRYQTCDELRQALAQFS